LSEPGARRTGTLFLVPTLLGAAAQAENGLPPAVQARVRLLQAFVAESAKSARQFLKAVGFPRPLAQTPIEELNEHTPQARIPGLLQPLRDGLDVGLLSEAGCPAVADPGGALVALAHVEGFKVVPLVGPSSLLLALMASGLNGQRFCFHGYLPVERGERDAAIRGLERASRNEGSTQLLIETPYRNNRLFASLTQVCQPDTLLCVAADLTLQSEFVRTLPVSSWRRQPLDLDGRPTVFVLQARQPV
jgi:16S rRNA (cytidine1402-2'-O)-methyltransferase